MYEQNYLLSFYLTQINNFYSNPEIAMEIGRPAAIRSIHRARRRVNPSIPQLLSDWPDIINSDEFGPQLLYVNGTRDFFFQGSLEILRDDGSIRFVGLVFTNVAFLQQMNAHIQTVRTLCMDGTFQVRPRQPPDIEQLFTVQIILNNVVSIELTFLIVMHIVKAYYLQSYNTWNLSIRRQFQ